MSSDAPGYDDYSRTATVELPPEPPPADPKPAPKTLREQVALLGGRDPSLPPGWVRHIAWERPRTPYQQTIEDRRRARLRLKRTRLRRARRAARRDD